MNKRISVVIRNRNEAPALEKVLYILNKIYASDLEEIIIVDNNSTDNSLEVAGRFGCKIVNISKFSYGRASNIGIEASSAEYVLLLSSHAIPVGESFFQNSLRALKKDEKIAGVRYVNSFANYERAIKNDLLIENPLEYGLMAACCIINKNVWNKVKFNEDLLAIEDKEWSKRVMDDGYKILDLNETYFYFAHKNLEENLNRYKIESITSFQLHNKKFPTPINSFLSLIKKIFVTNVFQYFRNCRRALLGFKTNLEIYQSLNEK